MVDNFTKHKKSCLSAADLSRKGSIDAPIVDLVTFINDRPNYFTTSSCSGRIVLFEESSPAQKKGCRWLLVSHDSVDFNSLKKIIAEEVKGDTVLKFEPFVLHVQCHHLEDAQTMHAVAVASGFRNSGITVGKKGKVITAVRSTHSLEVPLASSGELMVTDKYVEFVIKIANRKMEENMRRIARFSENLQEALEKQVTIKEDSSEKKKERKELVKDINEEKKRTSNCSDSLIDKYDFDDFEAVNGLFVEQSDIG
ncbi:tRNA wybutosine-synthesizing protein 3 homolog [Lineus longissimus]|uniref:tRNA wybutosine-synthesizing protein 3 homolog n=1 Tax=Lineus longissimus TaxID=88925 RepID=UPI002B4CEF5A